MVVSRSTVSAHRRRCDLPLFGAEARSDVRISGDAVRRSETTRGDGLATLELSQRAQASRAQDLDPTRVAFAAYAVDRHAPSGLASAGLVALVVTVIALAPLPPTVEPAEFVDIVIGLDVHGFLRSHHQPMLPGPRLRAQHGRRPAAPSARPGSAAGSAADPVSLG
ncbi:hypothetical protein CQ042_14565 [Microbacterium sp. MYb62]|nr:hypothetical protein CQ042_14565 [Microbacterium sp. MYb62]